MCDALNNRAMYTMGGQNGKLKIKTPSYVFMLGSVLSTKTMYKCSFHVQNLEWILFRTRLVIQQI